MDQLFNPFLLYGACALGALGVALALPRRGTSPQVLGGLIAAVAFGGIMLALAVRAVGDGGGEGLPNFNYYVFSLIALGGALRVISHPRPVYAALYFVLTILASCGLYVLLAAEFMAFALVIVYAGAILITYLFVIMLATESPTEEETEALKEYDRYSREPILATVMGFALLAVMTTLLGRGAAALDRPDGYAAAHRLADVPGRVEPALREAGLIRDNERVAPAPPPAQSVSAAPIPPAGDVIVVVDPAGRTRSIPRPDWLTLYNVEGVAFSLLAGHPGAIEIAGVILLMAMLGAVVLARKKVELDERARAGAAARHLTDDAGATAGGGGYGR